ncbi:MAG: SPOR domain-containing protein [Bacteroidota bacterium]
MKTITANILTALLIISGTLAAQLNEQDVRLRLDLIHSGKIEQVRTEVASLLKQLPNDPGVKFLEAYTTENGDQAAKKYQSFVETYPSSEWADDALYKVYQYYFAVGLYKTADAKLNQLNEQYPNSVFAKKNAKEPVQAVTQSTVKAVETPVVEPKKEAAVTSNVSGPFIVQLGVYSQEAKAMEQANTVTSVVGKQAVVFSKQSNGRTVYAVAFEGFADEQSAKAFGGELKSKFNLDWFAVKR